MWDTNCLVAAYPPPLVGFNNNVRYRGVRFHIQTEDSGIRRPHISTHLFANGGQVIKSIRRDYGDQVERADRAELVRSMMMDQHKAMAVALRRGKLDDLLGALVAAQSPAKNAASPETDKANPTLNAGAMPVRDSTKTGQLCGSDGPKTSRGMGALSQLADGTPPNEVPQTRPIQLPIIEESNFRATGPEQAPAQPIPPELVEQAVASGGGTTPHSETMHSILPLPPDKEAPLHMPSDCAVGQNSQNQGDVGAEEPGGLSGPKSRSPATQTSPSVPATLSQKPIGRPSPRTLNEPTRTSLFGATPEPCLDNAILGYVSAHSKRTTGKVK